LKAIQQIFRVGDEFLRLLNGGLFIATGNSGECERDYKRKNPQDIETLESIHSDLQYLEYIIL
jgi:hypothetical protein